MFVISEYCVICSVFSMVFSMVTQFCRGIVFIFCTPKKPLCVFKIQQIYAELTFCNKMWHNANNNANFLTLALFNVTEKVLTISLSSQVHLGTNLTLYYLPSGQAEHQSPWAFCWCILYNIIYSWSIANILWHISHIQHMELSPNFNYS